MRDIHKNKAKFFKNIIIIIIVFVIFIILNFNKTNFQKTYVVNKPRVQPKETKTILYWGDFFGSFDYKFGFGSEIFKNCEVQSCFATNNKTYLPIDKFDAILFHGARYSVQKEGLPTKRSKHQKYVFYSLESYYNTFFEPKVNKNFYNWTMSYKRDSDVFQPYGRLIENDTGYQLPTSKDLESRDKKVAWFVSNCQASTTKRRQRYVAELQKHIPVDIYGACGTLKCPRSDQCYEMLERNYKFYLSFENSLCEDYVTEKVYNVLKYNVVPIVFSFVDYDALFPKNCLINANKFINPKHLADYLWTLDANDAEYFKFFEWKKRYTVKDDYNLCNLCKKIHEPLEYSSYENVQNWYFGYNCVS